ncbi:hypothetical protein [Corynebacterium riegelii]|nr:hypothetical protein [Corynebacterium riegelii]
MKKYSEAIENWASLSGEGKTTTITGTLLDMLGSLGKLAGNVKGLLELL